MVAEARTPQRARRPWYREIMRIRIGYELAFEVSRPTAMQLMLYVHPDHARALRYPEKIVVEPALPVEDFIDGFGNRAARILTRAGSVRIRYDNVIDNSGSPDVPFKGLRLTPVHEMPPECWRFLLASRYCEVDRMGEIAWNLFGSTPESWERVQAVVEWVHTNVTFGYEFASPTKSGYDVYLERQGVCRDFQHLAITFLRALNIPARYTTGFLGDIGVPVSGPMDFSAWAEAYLDGAWYTIDARHNRARIGRVAMARGRDAVDVALTTSFGAAMLTQFTVWADEVAVAAA
jgi:transglutaminase-like putative cysteine protease